MSTYAIGDVQGCYDALQQLLAFIHFDAQQDTLWFTGDLVNRGPKSLQVLEFIQSLGDKHIVVLGNHDLHLIAASMNGKTYSKDTFQPIFDSPKKEALIYWLKQQRLLYYDPELNFAMLHAGLAPQWDIHQALALSREVESVLHDARAQAFLSLMYGNTPDHWEDTLQGMDRLRCITNYLTRLRYCRADGAIDFDFKGQIQDKPADLIPWFAMPNRKSKETKIIFGHWAALNGETHTKNVYALDTGCVWGNCLTAMRLEDEKRFSIPCV